jgi:plasmid stabilization system protein ParE
MKASVSAEADRELTEGALHYAREGGAQVGAAFIAEFEKVIELLCAYPEIGAQWRGSRRRLPIRKFPYSIVYYVREDEIRVIALAHHRREPSYWASRK